MNISRDVQQVIQRGALARSVHRSSRSRIRPSVQGVSRSSLGKPSHSNRDAGDPNPTKTKPVLKTYTPPWPTTSSASNPLPYGNYANVPPAVPEAPNQSQTIEVQDAIQSEESDKREVIVPQDPQGLVKFDTPAAEMLSNTGLVVVRQLEMMNVFLGYEQANKYSIHTPEGRQVGFLAEEDLGLGRAIGRQMFRTHRAFKCTIMDNEGKVILRIHRPFSWINSRITVSLGEDPENVIGEAQQRWHPWRRRYELFVHRKGEGFEQFAQIDSGFLSWDFFATDSEGKVISSVNRNWAGFGREIFTDTGQYVLKFDAVVDELAETAKANAKGEASKALVPAAKGITLDQRAVLLACAMSIDVDYFSRNRGGVLGDSLMLPMMGGGWGSSDVQAPPPPMSGEDSGNEGDQVPGGTSGDEPTQTGGWDENREDPWAKPSTDSSAQNLDEGPEFQDPWSNKPSGSGESSESGWGWPFGGGDEGGGGGGSSWGDWVE